jgi:hypothetical protein
MNWLTLLPMNEEERREILTAVAEGRMSPEEAAARLAGEETARGDERPGDDRHDDQPIRRVRVKGTFRHARVYADPGVREAVAEGPHVARREGDTLIIESEQNLPGFTFHHGGRRGGFPFAVSATGTGWWSGEVGFPPHLTVQPEVPLTVRMNPELPLAVDLTAGRITVDGLRGPLRMSVTAGSAELRSFSGPLDVKVTAGSVRADGVLSHGESRVRCEAGSVKLHLGKGSDVRIRTKSDLGRVVLPDRRGRTEGWLTGGVEEEVTIGEGTATLEVEVAMGDVAVTSA